MPAESPTPETAGDYIRMLDEIPGWFTALDARLLIGVDDLQKQRGTSGDLLEIGVYMGKSAILLGYLPRHAESLIVCDVFGEVGGLEEENVNESATWYSGLRRGAFESQFLRFHRALPTVWQMPSTSIDRAERAGTCRLIHVDGAHTYEAVREDIATARALLGPGGVAVFDDWATPHAVGVHVALWEEFLRGDLRLLCLSPVKLYATWDPAGLRREDVEGWVESQPDLDSSGLYHLAHGEVRLVTVATPAPEGSLSDPAKPPVPDSIESATAPLPDPAKPPVPDPTESATAPLQVPPARRSSRRPVRGIVRQIAPPILLTGYRRLRAVYRSRRGASQ